MVGANCSIFGCGSNRRHSGISIFSLPKGKDDLSTKTRDEWVRIITRNREIDKDLQRQISAGNLHIREKHFEVNCLNKRKYSNFFVFIQVMNIQVLLQYFASLNASLTFAVSKQMSKQ